TGAVAGVVSALHAELRFADGEWRLADLGSRNGTYVNERRLHAPVPLRPGDVIGLGESGPRFEVAAVTERPPLPPTLPERPGLPAGDRAYGITLLDAVTGRRYEAAGVRIRIGRGREGKRGSAAFVRAVAAQGSPRWLMGVVMVSILLLGGAVYGVYWLLSTQVEQTNEVRQSVEDSVRLVTRRLEQDLDAARASAAPAALVESLRTQLGVAQARTAELRTALDRAQTALGGQLAAGEARRVAAQSEV